MRQIFIELDDEVALSILIELETHVRGANVDMLDRPPITAVTRKACEQFREQAIAARDAYRKAYRDAMGYE